MIRGREAIYLVLIDDSDDHVTEKTPSHLRTSLLGTQFALPQKLWPTFINHLTTTYLGF